ncbi:hypothetical protein [Dinoroseobacter sp. S124A]|uniref:hypothetical protein n=1 Tax=Dinoroseobacter sp. S124A TaxID=3415128 RepID=UPI003C7B8F64
MPRIFAALICLTLLGHAGPASAGDGPLLQILSWTEEAWERLRSLDEAPERVDRRAQTPSVPFAVTEDGAVVRAQIAQSNLRIPDESGPEARTALEF